MRRKHVGERIKLYWDVEHLVERAPLYMIFLVFLFRYPSEHFSIVCSYLCSVETAYTAILLLLFYLIIKYLCRVVFKSVLCVF